MTVVGLKFEEPPFVPAAFFPPAPAAAAVSLPLAPPVLLFLASSPVAPPFATSFVALSAVPPTFLPSPEIFADGVAAS